MLSNGRAAARRRRGAPIFRRIADRCMGINRELLATIPLPDTLPYGEEKRLAGWSQKDELYGLVAELKLNSQVQGQGDWARLAGAKHIRLEVQDVLADDMVPELSGMGIRDAIYLLENKGMRVKYRGVGRVTGQSLKSGQPVEKGKTIHLTLG